MFRVVIGVGLLAFLAWVLGNKVRRRLGDESLKAPILWLAAAGASFAVLTVVFLVTDYLQSLQWLAYFFALPCFFACFQVLRWFKEVNKCFAYFEPPKEFSAARVLLAVAAFAALAWLAATFVSASLALETNFDYVLLAYFIAFSLFGLGLLNATRQLRCHVSEPLLVNGLNWSAYSVIAFSLVAQSHALLELTGGGQALFWARPALLLVAVYCAWKAVGYLNSFTETFSFKR